MEIVIIKLQMVLIHILKELEKLLESYNILIIIIKLHYMGLEHSYLPIIEV